MILSLGVNVSRLRWCVWHLLISSLLVLICYAKAEPRAERSVLGWVERVKLQDYKIILHAKLDTGADHSSLNASDLEEFSKGERKWVRFTVRNRYGEETVVEKPVLRTAHIKGHVKNQKRVVIRLGICVANVFMEEEVSLVDRSQFDYQMLVGRSFLAGKALVDPASAYLIDPECA